jgi:hypothetical protein
MNRQAFIDRVEAYTIRASHLFPGSTTFTKKELAEISGKAYSTLCNSERYRFPSRRISIKEFIRMEMS